MFKLVDYLEKVSAVLGAFTCVVSGVFRLSGSYYLAGVQVMSIFTAGMALMVFACLLKLHHNDFK
ncbi:MAG: hypothetical protein OEY52_01290 [Gammaproteobacteria bacterium]|nr:hypothetical protein [Gammaproteobacteria bacterium]